MTLQTWKAEFYTIEAEEATDTTLIAAQHSLMKWRGLTTENLERHGLVKEGESRYIWNGWGDRFAVDGYSCALCSLFDSHCPDCPLRICEHEYRTWYEKDDPKPMISSLEELVTKLENEKEEVTEEVDYSDPGWDE
jgi:hypothetical protein